MIHIDWKPSKESSKPLYIQIVEYFKEKINRGDWPVGSEIPTQRALARMFEVNRSTIVSALDELKAEGILEGKRKAGTKIINHSFPSLTHVQPNWQSYIEEGIHIPNLKTIKQINELEFNNHFIRLSTGEASPELFPAEKMAIVLREISKSMKNLGYEEPKGMVYLREQISNYLKLHGINASLSSILIVSGALQAIQLIAMGLLQPGSTVFLEKPSYLYSLQILQSMGMRRGGIPMDEEGIIGRLIKKYKRKNKSSILYTIPNFQNPTATVMSQNRRKELIKICQQEKIPIIEDDVYRELWIDNPPPTPLKSLDTNGLVLYVGSISKTLSPGLRIGWIVGPEPVINRLSDIKMQTDYGSSSLAQLTVGKWIETGLYEEHLHYLRKQLAIRRNITMDALEKYFSDIATWKIPSGGYYVWLSIKDPISMYKLFDEACKIGILLYPGYIYDSSPNQYLRISYSYASVRHLQEGLYKLSKLIRKLIKSNHK
ncbi:PLP-dependent aminotransferase family protein [Crassaminicella thermophila]|uniref:PLP-dependent aminotransferase family protein n=1 Tax=Crassaminicella thermophila TaxID=2599308 RepID=A0A5C0SIA6_CRATE|nr:PLP-dependent aminotransferase family protein [Crassaminicella thermophila]QEK13466.1 PLP-dependent aminotransferase family protein [Crassaminicella thermophila]